MGMRAFLAVDLDEQARRAAGELARRLEREVQGGGGVRWVRPENYHVTLRFLGDIDPRSVAPLVAAVARAIREIPPFALSLGTPRLFPSPRRPRLVALDLEPEAPLRRLAQAVEAAAVEVGFAPEKRSFRAHLTLGRMRGHARLARVPQDPPRAEAFPVREVNLVESHLHPDGARYESLERIALGGFVSPATPTSEGEEHGEE